MAVQNYGNLFRFSSFQIFLNIINSEDEKRIYLSVINFWTEVFFMEGEKNCILKNGIGYSICVYVFVVYESTVSN